MIRRFIDRWLEPIVKACEWIRDACARTDHDGVHGLPPPATATDRHIPTQAVWNLGWHYRGLISAVQVARAARSSSSRGIRTTGRRLSQDAVSKRCARPRPRIRRGPMRPARPITSCRCRCRPGAMYTHHFYLDTGPLLLVYAGLLDADDPLMRSTIEVLPRRAELDDVRPLRQPRAAGRAGARDLQL